jgi:hypothetical protein
MESAVNSDIEVDDKKKVNSVRNIIIDCGSYTAVGQ